MSSSKQTALAMLSGHDPTIEKIVSHWRLTLGGDPSSNKDRNELDAFCSTAGIVPDRFLCTDIRKCGDVPYWSSTAAISMNAQVRAQCGPVSNEITMVIPYETYAPSEETIAEIKAEIGDIQAWQRDRVIRQAVQEMGGPE